MKNLFLALGAAFSLHLFLFWLLPGHSPSSNHSSGPLVVRLDKNPMDQPLRSPPLSKNLPISESQDSLAQEQIDGPATIQQESIVDLEPRDSSSNLGTFDLTHGAEESNLYAYSLHLPKPDYPPAARRFRMEGTAEIEIFLDDEGNVTKVSLIKSSGFPLLDKSVEETVKRKWKFPPGLLERRVTREFEFRLTERS